MTTEVINIVVREDGSRVVKRNLEEIGDGASTAAGELEAMGVTFGRIAGLIAAAGIGLAMRSFITNTIEAERTVAQLEAVLRSTAGVSGMTSEGLQQMASDLQDVTTFGDEAIIQMQSVLLTFTKLRGENFVNAQESVINLATAMKMDLKSAALQVGKALNDPVLGISALSRAGIQFTDEQKDLIKTLAESGDMAGAQAIILKELEVQFGGSARAARETLGGALDALREKFGDMFELSIGFTEPLRKGIEFIIANMETILKIVTILAVTIAAAFVPTMLAVFSGWLAKIVLGLKAVWALMLANPIGAVLVALTALVSYLVLFRDEIKLGIDDTTTLGDLMRSIWESIAPVISWIGSIIRDFFNWLTTISGDAYDSLNGDVNGYAQTNESAWLKAVRFVAQALDMIGGTIRGFTVAAWATISKLVDLVTESFSNMADAIEAAFNLDKDALRAALTAQQSLSADAGTTLATAFGDAFREEQLSQADSGIEAWLNGRIARAKEIGAERTATGAAPGFPPAPGGGGGGGGGGGDPDAAKRAKELADALNNLLNQINPIRAAEQQLAAAQKTLNDAVRAGMIEATDATAAYEKLKLQMRDQLDPYGAMIDAMKEEAELSKMLGGQRVIEMEVRDRVNELTRAGVDVTKEMTDALRAQLIVQSELDRIGQMKESLLSNSVSAQQAGIAETLAGIVALREEAPAAFGAVDAFNAANEALGGIFDNTTMRLQMQMEQYTLLQDHINMLAQSGIITEQAASEARMQIWYMEQEAKLASTQSFLGTMSGLMQSSNKKMFAVGKAAAIAQAIINTYLSVTKAMAELPWPLNIVAAGANLAMGLMQVSKIRSQQPPAFRTGGSMTVGGNGGVDSQTVAFRATPGEQVSINTPAQARALERMAEMDRGGDRNFTQNVTIVQTGKPDRKTSEHQARSLRRQTQKEFERNN